MSSQNSTLIDDDKTSLPPLIKIPSAPPRHYKSAVGSIEREGEAAEREMADYGGDSLSPSLPPVGRQRAGTGGRRMSRSTTPAFPPLHLVDSAFADAHRARSISVSQPRTMAEESSSAATSISGGGEEKVDSNKVQWTQDDPENPQNWSTSYKWVITALVSLLTINVTFASTAPSSATVAIAQDFGVTPEISVLGTSLFLFGYCTGPILWAPLSEILGRRLIFIITMGVFTILQIGDALAMNIETLLIIRFLAGTFAAAPLTNAGGTIADTWDSIGRGPAMSFFSASVFLGPVFGPIVGGYLTDSYLTWRWIFWVQMIFGGLCWVLIVAYLPETYAPVLLAKRAVKLRKEDPVGNKDLYAELERADFSFKGIVTRTLARPFIMLAKELILVLVTLYMSIIYGLLYALFSIFPLVWGQLRGFSLGQVGLVFIGVGIGTTIGAGLNIYLQRHYKVLVPKWHGHPPPEERLWGAMYAGPFLVVGIFFFGWTGAFASIPWWVPAIATVILGVSFTLVFISFLTYLIEVYLMYSASALAANTIIRSAVGGAFPLFTDQFFSALGIGGACSLIGGIAILIAPTPIIFYYYGARIRAGSTFAPCLDIHMKDRVEREEREELEGLTGEKVKFGV